MKKVFVVVVETKVHGRYPVVVCKTKKKADVESQNYTGFPNQIVEIIELEMK